jgi:hypothetical protein
VFRGRRGTSRIRVVVLGRSIIWWHITWISLHVARRIWVRTSVVSTIAIASIIAWRALVPSVLTLVVAIGVRRPTTRHSRSRPWRPPTSILRKRSPTNTPLAVLANSNRSAGWSRRSFGLLVSELLPVQLVGILEGWEILWLCG